MPSLHTPTRSLVRRIAAKLTPRRCLLVAMMLFMLMVVLGAIPGKAQELTTAVHDKLLHFLAYGLLSALIYGGLPTSPVTRCIATLIAVASLGAIDEAIQALLPYREASWFDWEVDMMAALTCVVLMPILPSLTSVTGQRSVEPKARPDRPE